MGLLVEGQWRDQWYETASTDGRFVRGDAFFRDWITTDGSPGPSGKKGYKAEADRYHLYVSLACPWAHRTLIYRELKGLQEMIGLSVVNAIMREEGWTFNNGDDVVPDTVNNTSRLHELYTLARPDYTGRVTVPILWDKQEGTIVSNESSEIIRMFNSSFDEIGALPGDYYPEPLRDEIDAINKVVYHGINNGVYKAGFATTQEAYEEAVLALFDTLNDMDLRLSSRRYLVGEQITEADWRLFTTLIRFDAVYVGHFKCNIRRIEDYPNLSRYLLDLYQQPGIAETVNIDNIKTHYYGSHETINPSLVVPVGPVANFDRQHGREKLAQRSSVA